MIHRILAAASATALLAGCTAVESGGSRTRSSLSGQASIESSADRRANGLQAAVEELKGVREAAVVVTGNTAIVGLAAEPEMDNTELLALKRRVEKTVKSSDSGIDHVAISCAPDLFTKISETAGD